MIQPSQWTALWNNKLFLHSFLMFSLLYHTFFVIHTYYHVCNSLLHKRCHTLNTWHVEHIPSCTLFSSTSITSQSVISDRSNELYYNHTNSPSLSFQYNHNPSVHRQQLSAKLPKNFIHNIKNVYVHNQDNFPTHFNICIPLQFTFILSPNFHSFSPFHHPRLDSLLVLT
jgi:hypothetical protein